MDKSGPAPKKLVRPTASSSDNAKNGSANPSVTSITEGALRKISSTAPISQINANRPGRLASFRGERDLTLGGARPGADAGAKPKKVFTPTIPARRAKAQDASNASEVRSPDISTSRGRGRRDVAPRGRGRGKPELIQTSGSIFGEGVSDVGMKNRSSSNYAIREDSGSTAGLEKPKLSALDTKVDKEQEDAALKNLLRDDFIDYGGDQCDPSLLLEPIQLPKIAKHDLVVKKEENQADQHPVVSVDGVAIKQEKEELKPQTYERRATPSEITAKDIFESDGELLFFQLPDVLPSLKADKERPVVKVEPGTSSQKTNESVPQPIQETSQSDGVFESTQEGRLGTLRIHQSGKVTLQMGEHSFVIDSATQVSFLQDLISVDVDTQEKRGTMKALGTIKYKAICLPDWDDLIKDS